MNNIRFEHPGKLDDDGKAKFVMGGRGKLFINGHQVEGVLEFTPHVAEPNDVAHVTIKLAVSKFTYGPEEEEYLPYQFLEGDKEARIPTVKVKMHD